MGDERDETGEAVLAAWRSLPSEHRFLLWRLVVHDEGVGRRASRRDTAPRGVTDPAERARDRLRLGLLSELVARAERPECAAARRSLGAHLRHLPSAPATREAKRHLEGCARCRTAVALLDDVDGAIRTRVAPALLPGAFTTALVEGGAPPGVAEPVAGDTGGRLGRDTVAGDSTAEGSTAGALTSGALTSGASTSGDSTAARAPAGRVLSVPGRPFALLTAAGALVLAAVMLRLEWVPDGRVTADAPPPRPSVVPSLSVGAPSDSRAAGGAPGSRAVIGAAVAESASGRPATGALAAGASRPDGPAGLRARFGPRGEASAAGGSPVGIRTRPAGVAAPGPTSPLGTSEPTTAPVATPLPAPAPTTPAPTTPLPTTPPRGPVVPAGDVASTRVFVPADQGTFVATLVVSRGWLLTSVLDERGRVAVEHVATPTTGLVDRMHAGRVVVQVTRVSGTEGTGALVVSFVGPSGAVLPGSGTYALR